MSKKTDKLIAKMRKLLAMAEGKANEHEAMVATKMLHSLLAKHNMSVADLAEEDEIAQGDVLSASRPWKKLVAQSIARLYFCEFYTMMAGKGKCHYVFVGSEANRTFAMHIFTMVTKTIERESRKVSREKFGKEVSGFVNSFWTGAQRRISERCSELKREGSEGNLVDEEGNTLPALLSTYETIELQLSDWISENLTLKNRNTNTRATDRNGLNAGKEAGNRVQLSRALQSNNGPKLIGAS